MRSILTKISKREKIILYFTAAAVIALLFDRVVLSQVMNKINTVNREIRVQEKKLQNALYTLSQEPLIANEHKEYTPEVRQKYSDEEEKSQLNSEIVSLAKKAGVFLTDIQTRSIEKKQLYSKYTVEIEVESKISFLADFIYQVEKSPHLLRVEKFYLTPREKKEEVLKAEMTITGILLAERTSGN